MSFDAGAVQGSVELDVDDFRRGIADLRKGLDELNKRTKEAEQGQARFARALALARDAVVVITGVQRTLRAAFRSVAGVLTEASQAASVYEDSVRGLSTALALQGSSDVPKTTAAIEELAATLERTTKFSDDVTISVAQTLTVLGVQEDQLEQATKAVLDYSAATGRDAEQSAINFGKTLAGLTGELGEAFPALRNLTTEQLKAGEAFKLAEQTVGGFAESVGVTASARIEQFFNALNNVRKEVGFVINEFAGPFAQVVGRALLKFRDELKNGGAAAETLRNAVSALFNGLASTARFLIDAFLRVRVVIKTVEQGLNILIGATVQAIVTIPNLIARLVADALNGISAIFAKLAEFEALPARLRTAFEGVSDSLSGTADDLDAGAEAADALADEFFRSADAAKQAALQAESQRIAILEGKQALDGVPGVLQTIANLQNNVKDATAETVKQQKELPKVTRDWGAALKERLQQLDKINGITRNAEGNIEDLAAATEGAAAGTRALAEGAAQAAGNFERAAVAAGRTAQSAAAAGSAAAGAGGGGGGGIPIRRGVLSTTSLDFSDPFRAAAQAQQALAAQRAVSTGGIRADVGAFTLNAAARFAEGVRAEARASIERAIAGFSEDVISELNSRGIFDQAERNAILRQRLAEAEKLGIIPRQVEGGSRLNF